MCSNLYLTILNVAKIAPRLRRMQSRHGSGRRWRPSRRCTPAALPACPRSKFNQHHNLKSVAALHQASPSTSTNCVDDYETEPLLLRKHPVVTSS